MKTVKITVSLLLSVLLLAACLVPAFAADPDTCDHTWIWVVDTEPTCGQAGTQHQYCPACGSTKEGTENTPIPATNRHDWNDGEVETEPTCAKAGKMKYTCNACGNTKTAPIAATGNHTYAEDTSRYHAPTCARPGERVYVCSGCGREYAKDTDALGEPRPDHVDADGNGQCDNCGVSVKTSEGTAGTSFMAVWNRIMNFFYTLGSKIQALFKK